MLHGRDHRAQPGQAEGLRNQEQGEGQPFVVDVHGQEEQRHGDQEADSRDQRIPGPVHALAELVGQPAAEPDAGGAADEGDARDVDGAFDPGHAQRAFEEAGEPEGRSIAVNRRTGRPEGQEPEAGLLQQNTPDLAEAGGLGRDVRHFSRAGDRFGAVKAAPDRILDREFQEGREQHAGEADDDEGHTPVDQGRQNPAEQVSQRRADRDAEGIDGQGAGPLRLGEIVGHEGIGRRDPARLADADTHTGPEKRPEAGGQAAQGGEPAPDRQRHADDRDAAHPVGQPGDGQGQGRIDDREGRTAQQPHHLVIKAHLGLDVGGQDGEDLPVDEVEGVDHHQQRQHIGAIGRVGGGPDALFRHAHGVSLDLVFLVDGTVASLFGSAKEKGRRLG